MKPIEIEEELKIYELNAQLELMHELIYKVEHQLKNCLDLRYLTAETALKIMHNHFLTLQSQLMSSKHKVQVKLLEIIHEKRN